MTTPSISDEELQHLLSRLSQKQSVQSVLILSRVDGGIIRTAGSVTRNDEVSDQYASLVWKWLKANEELVQGLEQVDEAAGGNARETEDDLKLLRLRTKRRELVVVPDPKFILVVFHDTPSA